MKVLVLCGGDSSEYDISLNSARNIIKYIDNPEIWYIKNHTFYKVCGNLDEKYEENSLPVDNLNELKNFDIVFPVFHGKYGEDGCIQGLLEILNIPYVGCDVLSSAICMDKGVFKIIMDGLGIPNVPYKIYTTYPTDIKEYPIMVKPCNGGSSIGISKVNSESELKEACDVAFKYDKRIIVEKWIDARELECSILEEDNNLIISPVGEIKSKDFYDYNSKYVNDTELVIPANLSIENILKIQEYSLKIFKELGCKGLSRIDFFLSDKVYINEVNTMPGFTDISMYPKLLNYSGYTNKEIIDILLKNKR